MAVVPFGLIALFLLRFLRSNSTTAAPPTGAGIPGGGTVAAAISSILPQIKPGGVTSPTGNPAQGFNVTAPFSSNQPAQAGVNVDFTSLVKSIGSTISGWFSPSQNESASLQAFNDSVTDQGDRTGVDEYGNPVASNTFSANSDTNSFSPDDSTFVADTGLDNSTPDLSTSDFSGSSDFSGDSLSPVFSGDSSGGDFSGGDFSGDAGGDAGGGDGGGD